MTVGRSSFSGRATEIRPARGQCRLQPAGLVRVLSGTRAPRFKREIPRFNDELKRKNFPRRAVNACGVQLGSGGAVFRSTPAEVARAQREIAAFRRGVASAVRLFEAAVLGERREAELSLRAERQVEKPHSYGVRESPPPRAARGAARHTRVGLFLAKFRWRRLARSTIAVCCESKVFRPPLAAGAISSREAAYCGLPRGVAAAVMGRSRLSQSRSLESPSSCLG